ncbi:MAG: class I SAM-dependent methyltransferase [Gammaproteobacteria bacterium]|nr:class I SAM-dependent methyltransferase [Gammaproteobacteria bacterium]
MNETTKVGDSYQTSSPEEQRTVYDNWAQEYEKDLCQMGYRIPAVAAAVFTRFVPLDCGPILDAGCGGGIQAEPLHHAGYGPITGIDFSEGMLDVAREKGIYAELRQMELGKRLDFEDQTFPAILSCGTITPRHAPPHSFDELLRIAKKGAFIVFSMRNDPNQEPEYPAAIERHTSKGHWQPLFATEGFLSMPYGEPTVSHQIHVYQTQ